MLGKIYDDQTQRYVNHDRIPLSYYETGTDQGRPVIKVFYDDGSTHLIDLTTGGLTADSPTFVANGSSIDPTTETQVPNISADGSYLLTVNGGSDGTFTLVGDYGGGTATLQYVVGGVPVTYDNSSLTANGGFSLRWATDTNYINLAGATNPSLTALACFE